MSQTSRAITAAPKGVTLLSGLLAVAFLFGASATWAQTSVTNTATVSHPGDLTPVNNSASDTDTVTARKLTLTKLWSNAIDGNAVSLTISGGAGDINAAVAGSSTAPSTTNNATADAKVGATITLTEAFTAGSAANYTTTLACIKVTGGASVAVTGSGLSGTLVMPGDSDVTCTFTNTRKTATLTLQKTWVNAIVGDDVSIDATGLLGLGAVADSPNETDTSSARTVRAGDVLTLSETFNIGSAANYTTTLACTGTSGLSGSTLTIGSADTAIVCTYTNTRKSATVAIQKTWVNARVLDAVNITATGLTGLNSVANVASETDAQIAQTVYAGDAITFAETFATGSAANYTTTLACTGTSGLSGSVLTAGSADTAIVCTYTNTRKTATVTLQKTWVGAELNHAVIVAATGLTSLNAVANTASETDAGSAQTVGAGDVLTLSETFTTGSAANYTTTLACTGTSGLSGSTLTIGSADTAIVCTYTNTFNPDTSLTVDKTAGTPTGNTAGSTIAYSFLVSNTGNVTLTGIVVNDAQLDAAASCPVTTLAPGASTTCTGTHTITQAEVNAGVVNNSATVTGNPPSGGPTTSAPDTTSTPITQSPSLTVDKTAGTPTGNTAGSTIAYSFLVSNTGNVTLTGIVVNDAQLDAAASCPVTTLAPGASTTCTGTHTITQAEVNAGVVNNSATVTGNPPSGGPTTSAPDTTSTPITQSPSLTVDKTAGTPTGNTAGSTIAYSFLVSNTGNVTLTGIVVNDAQLDAAASCPVTTLAPGASTTCTGTHTITQAEVNAGVVNNSATVTGNPPSGGPTTSAPDTTSTPITQSPSLTVDKTAGTPTGNTAGSTIAYSFLVSNTGNVTLTGIVVNDAQLDAAASCPVTTLAPGASTTCTGTHTITQAEVNAGVVNNSATVTGNPPSGGPTTSAPDTTSTPITQSPSQTVVKVLTNDSTGGSVALGDVLTYTVTMTNTGNTTLTGVVVSDVLITPNSITCASVLPGSTCVLTGTYTVTQADVNAGSISNTGTVTSPLCPAGGAGVCTTTIVTTVPQTAALTIDKTAGTPTGNTAGSTIAYSFLVSNTGNVTLTGIVINDPQLNDAASCSVTTLAPGASTTCTGTHTITQAEVNAGVVNNSATATGNPPSGGSTTSPPDTTSTPIVPNPVISVTDAIAPEGGNLVHTATLSGPTQFPSTYPFSLTGVTATAGDDFTAITPTFSNGVTLSGGFILVPAGISNFTITYAALIDDVYDDGETTILSIGGVSGTGTITDQGLPELRIVKQVNTRQATIGGMVQYSITITNTGNAPAVNFDIIDTPSQGFSYVPGSAVFQDGNNVGIASGTGPVTFSGLDVAVGQTATIRYLMRVSAGLPSGEYVNRAQAFKDGTPLSNESTASVRLDKGTDPLFEQSRVWGKVWDDRNGDGWQDPDEKGIPGVRLATVEGLVAETDAKGRYHFEGLTLSNMQRGQNFIVKVDVSTLPEGSAMMTENPLLRRITPAVPVRFDFGVKLPPQVAPEALPVIAPVPNEPVRLGAVFFDTDKTTIKPEYMAMLRDAAARIENGGTSTVLLTGFADKRASVAYNLDLARRRAQAVYAEIARQLSPEAKGRLRVELDSAEPATGAQP